jgi:alkylation response protein AidB-like acyl-CoA dehydrogenase
LDLDLSSDQELFLETTRKFLTAHWPTAAVRGLIDAPDRSDAALVRRGAELGWTSMLVPEEHGGGTISGAGVRDLGVVTEEMGRFLVPGPVVPTNVVAFALAARSSDQPAKEHLPHLAAGGRTATWAVSEGDDPMGSSGALTCTASTSGYTLTGHKTPVPDANAVDLLLVTVRSGGGVTQLLAPADATGVSIRPLEGLDVARRYCRVEFDRVEVPAEAVIGEPDDGESRLRLQLALTLALQCAETVGATNRLYQMTLDYARNRKSFGRPIGSYQALKHRLAEMLFWLESAKAATTEAVAAVQAEAFPSHAGNAGETGEGPAPSGSAFEAACVAKAYVADRCPVIARDCMQMHGGIGYTWEHDLHLFLRRVEANSALLGGRQFALDQLAAVIGFGRD